jgi:dTDP-4-dehydrorhamnose 3,5-epimerase
MDPMKEKNNIEGVVVQQLKQIADDRGAVLHMLRCDSPLFEKFGEVYFSEINPGIIKAWKLHKKLTQNIAVPIGKVRLVIYDDRPSSSTCGNISEYKVGRHDNYCLVHIPPVLWYGFQSLDTQTSLIANCTNLAHDPSEAQSMPSNSDEIPYQWDSA